MLKVSNIAVSLDEKDYAKVIANTLNIRKSQVKNVKIAKKAVDARRKNKVHFNMGFTFEYVDEDQLLKIQGSILDRDTIGYITGADVRYYDENGEEIDNIFLLNRKLR